MKNFHINRINFQEGVVSCRVDLKSMLIKQLLDKYPELIKDTEEEYPRYLKCVDTLKGNLDWTVGRVYEVRGLADYPRYVLLMSNTKKQIPIPFWDNGYFEPSSKEEFDKQELLDKAKRDYPVGTVFKSWYQDDNFNMMIAKSDHRWDTEHNLIVVATNRYPLGATLYKDGRWAEIVPYKFTTEDGVDIYGDMKTYAVHVESLKLQGPIAHSGDSPENYKYFFHKENALAYMRKYKEKSLEDYENLLLDSTVDYSIDKTYYSFMAFYNMLKMKEPKLYYTKILQLIADDLNDGWVADYNNCNQPKYFIEGYDVELEYGIGLEYIVNRQGIVYFKSNELVGKAKDILGSRVKFLFN